jgi:hypothetical protein
MGSLPRRAPTAFGTAMHSLKWWASEKVIARKAFSVAAGRLRSIRLPHNRPTHHRRITSGKASEADFKFGTRGIDCLDLWRHDLCPTELSHFYRLWWP